MRPIIGVSGNVSPPGDPQRSFSKNVPVHYIQEHYLTFVEAGGGLPVVISPLPSRDSIPGIVARMDGLLVIGGVDVDPSLYGQENTHSRGCDLARDRFDMALIEEAVKRDRPLLCICRGTQLLNVLYGGSLHQDIPTTFPDALKHHRWEDGRESFHSTQLVGQSTLRGIMAEDEFRINSSHHQSVDRPGDGIEVVSRADDGIVEAIAIKNNPRVVAVQWHPERMQDDPRQVALAEWLAATSGTG